MGVLAAGSPAGATMRRREGGRTIRLSRCCGRSAPKCEKHDRGAQDRDNNRDQASFDSKLAARHHWWSDKVKEVPAGAERLPADGFPEHWAQQEIPTKMQRDRQPEIAAHGIRGT